MSASSNIMSKHRNLRSRIGVQGEVGILFPRLLRLVKITNITRSSWDPANTRSKKDGLFTGTATRSVQTWGKSSTIARLSWNY